MDLFAPIDQYCERTGPEFLAEPLNLITNISFLIAGFILLKYLKKMPSNHRRPGSTVLPSLILIIGVGSALFHSFANTWSKWADVLPIGVFVVSYLWLFLRHEAQLSTFKSLALLVGFFLLSLSAASLADTTAANGGQAYFGTWITIFGITCFYGGRGQGPKQRALALATVVFSASLLLRTLDLQLCNVWPIGTHIFWHILNGLVLFLVTGAYMKSPGRP